MKETLLVLGSDYGTLDLVLEAKRMGLYVIAADLMESSPTKNAADESWLISTTDIDTLAERCIAAGVKGVVTGASNFNTTQARKLCKKLNLPAYCVDDEAWKICENKRAFKDACMECGAPVAKDYRLSVNPTNDELNAVQFPVVVKPEDASGNRGMSYCNNKAELIEALSLAKSVSNSSTVIVEKHLHGPEFAVHYVIANGEARLLLFGGEHNQPGEMNNMYSLVYTTSCHLKQYLEEVNDRMLQVFKKMGCTDGIVWIECIRDEDGHFYCFEMGYRFGATMMYTQYEKVSGFNAIRWMIECALGKKHNLEDLPDHLNKAYLSTSASYHLFSLKEDLVDHIDGLEEIEALGNVIIDIPKRGGHTARYRSCIGVLRIFAEDCEHLIGTLKTINRVLKIVNAQGEHLTIRFDDYDTLRNEYRLGLNQFNLI